MVDSLRETTEDGRLEPYGLSRTTRFFYTKTMSLEKIDGTNTKEEDIC